MKFEIAVCLLAFSYAAAFNEELNDLWERFKATHGKKYSIRHEGLRRIIWEQKVARIVKHNLEYDLGMHSYTLGINKYSDLTHEEIASTMLGYKHSSKKNKNITSLFTFLPPSNIDFPESVDWRKKGFVTGVKDQGACGSCWAFSATGSMEGQHKKKTGHLVSLSEQNLVDCSIPEGNYGCSGGLMDNAFKYVEENKGIDTEASYPYEEMDDKCRFRNSTIGATVKGYADILSGDENALKVATAIIGPISVAIDADSDDFTDYSGGIYDNANCSSTDLDHGVLVVGYGTEDGKDYWLVKNSWGKSWGVQGYIKMSRNKNNQCGIASVASFPIV